METEETRCEILQAAYCYSCWLLSFLCALVFSPLPTVCALTKRGFCYGKCPPLLLFFWRKKNWFILLFFFFALSAQWKLIPILRVTKLIIRRDVLIGFREGSIPFGLFFFINSRRWNKIWHGVGLVDKNRDVSRGKSWNVLDGDWCVCVGGGGGWPCVSWLPHPPHTSSSSSFFWIDAGIPGAIFSLSVVESRAWEEREREGEKRQREEEEEQRVDEKEGEMEEGEERRKRWEGGICMEGGRGGSHADFNCSSIHTQSSTLWGLWIVTRQPGKNRKGSAVSPPKHTHTDTERERERFLFDCNYFSFIF